jgi:hypothetical protein
LVEASQLFQGPINEALGIEFDPFSDPIEYGLPFLRNWTKFSDQRPQMLDILRKYRMEGMTMLAFLSSEEQIQQLHERSTEYLSARFDQFMYMWCNAMDDISTIHLPEQVVRPAMRELTRMGKNLLGQSLELWNEEDYEVPIAYNLYAFYDVLTQLHDIPSFRITPRSQETMQQASDFILSHSANPETVSFFLPFMSTYWLDALKSYKEGSYQRAATLFYRTLGAHLNEISDETTGDRSQELARCTGILTWLVKTEALSADFTMIDFGSNDGSRLLRPQLDALSDRGIHVKKVLAIDLLRFPQPADGRWTFMKGDASKPGVMSRILRFFDGKRADVALDTWSPINDLHPLDQEAMFDRFNQAAEWVIVDVPVGYSEEIRIYHETHPAEPIGTIEREFTYMENLADGTQVKRKAHKKFTINPLADLIAKAHIAGLEYVEITDRPDHEANGVSTTYRTAAGRDRATLVFHRVREPALSLSQMRVASFAAHAPSEKPA